MTFTLGNSIIVKKGIKDLDLNTDLSGYQGRLSLIQEDNIVCVDWDSITLKAIPAAVIKYCEEEGFGWDQMYLGRDDIELTSPRDTENDVIDTFNQLQAKYEWSYLGKQGERIQAVLSDVDNEMEAFEAWETHLINKLKLPCQAIISDSDNGGGALRLGYKITIQGFNDFDDRHGILVDVKYQGSRYVIQLADLEVINQKSNNYLLVKDYVVWFANR